MKDKNTVLIIGAFGYRQGNISGQTDKIRLLYSELKKIKHLTVDRIDTSKWKRNPFFLLFSLLKKIKKSANIIFMPGRKGLMLLPLIMCSSSGNKKIHYIIIGGWLPSLLEKKKHLVRKLNRIDKIYAATEFMKKELNNFGLENVKVLPNFRRFSFTPSRRYIKEESSFIKTVFFSRVDQKKGISFAIDTINKFNNKNNRKIMLDIYGPIQKVYNEKFKSILKGENNYINYKGILNPKEKKTYKILSSYDFMIFPTFYEGEGFAGVIVNSFVAGLPVLASDWRYNSEIIQEGKTGLIFRTNDQDSLIEKLEWCFENREKLKKMRRYCFEEAKKYHVDNVLPKLLKEIKF